MSEREKRGRRRHLIASQPQMRKLRSSNSEAPSVALNGPLRAHS